MKTSKVLYSMFFIVLLHFVNCIAQDYHVRIGFIGNSITQGVGLSNPAAESFPAQFADIIEQKYGDTCIVTNFGLTTTTMIKNGDVPYWDSPKFTNCFNYAPDICVILLGTNDSKPQNWDSHGDEYISDYLSMIDTLRSHNPHMKIMVGYPPPAFEIKWGIRDSVILNGVIPAVDSVLSKSDAYLVDLYNPLLDSAGLFPDKIHPNVRGSRAIAQLIFDRFLELDLVHNVDTGLTFVTYFHVDDAVIVPGDSTTLTWTTINADSVFLNDQKVPQNGSMKVSPPLTTLYTLKATGDQGTDSLQLELEIYESALAKLSFIPNIRKILEGDTCLFKLKYYDHMNTQISDTLYPVEWEIADGTGYLTDKTDTSVRFVSVIEDTSIVRAKVGDVIGEATVFIKNTITGLSDKPIDENFMVYPNPCNNNLFFSVETETISEISIKIYDLAGILCLSDIFSFPQTGKQDLRLDTGLLKDGTYIFELLYDGNIITGKFRKQRNL